MGWITLSLRRAELQASIQDLQCNLLQMSRKMRQLSNFSTAIADGRINPSEISGMGSTVFGDAMDFMYFSDMAAAEAADLQTSYYEQAYSTVTADQYYNNPALASQASLYFDESGALNTDQMYNEFYEEALEEYANEVIMPKLKELEKDLENEKLQMETQLESQEAELESVKENISQSIQSSTIQL
ncbi:MAG: hypothetical protein IKL52_06315 [Candidatus Gastranaerophilales bacterium]|nr:hypothetical protein [Candidatus Gastranaerophilales bacterium]